MSPRLDHTAMGHDNTHTAGAQALRGIRLHQAKVMDVHPSRTAVLRLHRMTATNNPLFACGNRSASVGAFLD